MGDIKLHNIIREYKEGNGETSRVLDNLCLDIKQGEMVAITGVSGSGKTTLLHILGCMDKEYHGEYYLNNKLVSEYSSKQLAQYRNSEIGFVLQDYNLIWGQNVEDNVSIPLMFRKGLRYREIKLLVEEALTQTGIGELKKRKVTNLSGGQKQRVAIARSIVGNPSIILADEPTGALDRKTGDKIIQLFRKINQQGTTIVIVTHDENISAQCDKKFYMEDGKCKHLA